MLHGDAGMASRQAPGTGPAPGDRGSLLARAMQKIAVWPLVGQSYRFLLEHLGLFLRIGWFWFALTLVLGSILGRLVSGGPARYAAQLCDIPLVIAFAVAWHRATLIGEVPRGWVGGHLGARELRYAGWLVLLMLASFSVMVLGAAATYLAGATEGMTQIAILLLLIVGLLFVASRFILLFPAVALGDGNAGLVWSWRLTRGHAFALFFGIAAVSLPLLLVKSGILLAAEIFLPAMAGDVAEVAWLLPLERMLDFANMAISIAFMSYAYAVFTRRPPG
jgi:hypothetical protein